MNRIMRQKQIILLGLQNFKYLHSQTPTYRMRETVGKIKSRHECNAERSRVLCRFSC